MSEKVESGVLVAVVDKIRVLARTSLRMINIANLKEVLYSLNLDKQEVQKCSDELAKDVKRAEFALSKVDAADPDAEDLKKGYGEEIVNLNKEINVHKKGLEDIAKEVEAVNAKIAKWESGENKVQIENLNAKTKELLAEYSLEQARKI